MLVALAAVAASVARAVWGGQDLNFDLVTYHYYLGYSALQDRLGQDFLPAGPASYLPPLPYAALYLLDAAGVAPVVSAGLHAAVHAAALVVLLPLARILLKGSALENSRTAWLALWLLGAVAPAYWQVVGTSFADPLTSALVLGGLWLAAQALSGVRDRASTRLLALGGLVLGAAVGMRMQNAIFAVALAGALLLVRLPAPQARLRHFGVLCAAAAAGWLLCFAPWSWRLWREFGSPLFPMYNALLGSPDFPAANLPLVSFAPASLLEALALPFRIATYSEWSYGEKSFPDVRPALLVLAAMGLVAVRAYRRREAAPDAAPGARLVLWFFGIAAVLWLASSANNRYGLALLLLAGPVCGALLQRLLPLHYVYLAVGAAVLWQAVQHQVFFKQYRWPSGPWAARHFDWEVPEHLREPATYLSFGYKTASSLAPRLHPASRHANLVGPYSLGIDHPGARRMRELIDGSSGRLYGVFDFEYTQQADPAARSIKTYFAGHLRLWGLDFTDEPCTLVGLRPPSAPWRRFNQALGVGPRAVPPRFIVCKLRPAAAQDHQALVLAYRQLERKLASLAAACPHVLGPAMSLVRVHGQWQVTSFASAEYRLELDDAGPFHLQMLRPPYAMITLGEFREDAIGLKVPCDRLDP
jgi:hypothetical protein